LFLLPLIKESFIAMIQVLCHPGHSKRGKKLAARVAGSHYDTIISPTVTKKDLDTLIFLGAWREF
jgi:hypothetical protein